MWSWSALDGLLGRPEWEDFADGLESAHILPHVAVGGDMVSTHHAPNDPVFYLHHAYIDFVYAIRQGRHWRYQFGGTHDFAWGTQQCSADHVFGAFGVPARNAFDIWCVDYIAPQTRGINSGVAGRTQKRCEIEVFRSGVFGQYRHDGGALSEGRKLRRVICHPVQTATHAGQVPFKNSVRVIVRLHKYLFSLCKQK